MCEERFDHRRFVSAVWAGGLGALVDVAGHVVIVDLEGALICIFHLYRQQFAAWLPDGTRLGALPINGGTATPNAESLVSKALREAALRGKGVDL